MKNNLLTSITLLIICISCTDDMFNSDSFSALSEMVEISESEEMSDYVNQRLRYDNRILGCDTALMKRVFINDSICAFVIPIEDVYEDCRSAEKTLFAKYPEIQYYSIDKKRELISMTVGKHISLLKLNRNRRSFLVRTKSGNTDIPQCRLAHTELSNQGKISNNGITNRVICYDFISEAIDHCRSFSYETGGYFYSDNSALHYEPINPSTNSIVRWLDPLFVTPTPTEMYHYHPGGTLDYTGQDTVSAQYCHSVCPSLIYTNIVTSNYVRKILIESNSPASNK